MKKVGAVLLAVIGLSLMGASPAGAQWIQATCVRPTPAIWDAKHPVISGTATTLKGIVAISGDITGLTYLWDFGDGSDPASGSVTDPYAIEAEHVYTADVETNRSATLTVSGVDASGNPVTGTDSYQVRIVPYTPWVDPIVGRSIAIENALWWAHKKIKRYQGSAGPAGYVDFGTNPMGYPMPEGEMADASTIIIAQGFVDNGYKSNGLPGWSDPVYMDDVQRMLNYVVERLKATPISPKGDGSPEYPTLDPEAREGELKDGLGVYFKGRASELEYVLGSAVRLLASCGLADQGWYTLSFQDPLNSTMYYQWTFRQVLQQMVDFLAWSQLYQYAIDYGYDNGYGYVATPPAINTLITVPPDGRGSWPYWFNGWGWQDPPGRGARGDVAIGYWTVDGIREAEKRGAIVPSFVKEELRRFLTLNQDLNQYIPGTVETNPYFGELYFGPARAHHLVERAGEGLLLFNWAGMGTESDEVRGAVGFIDRLWNQHNYNHLTMWPWDTTKWDRMLPPNYSHFKRGDLYETGYFTDECVEWDYSGTYCYKYKWVSLGFIDELNIFGFLTITQGLQSQGLLSPYQLGPNQMSQYPNAANYQWNYLDLMINNQLADGSWDDSAWVYRMPLGHGWALMLLSRLMADKDLDGWRTDSDCNDDDNTIRPYAQEMCNGIDDNCDGVVDEGCSTYYRDADGDGFGNLQEFIVATSIPGGYVNNSMDCNDTDLGVNPSALETCNNVDDNCNGAVDEGLSQATTCGQGICSGNTGVQTCEAGQWVGNTCNPLAGARGETCNNLDDNCDGAIDEGLSQATTCGQGICSGNTGVQTCDAGQWVGNTCNPLAGATAETKFVGKTCRDGIDNDCDGLIDRNDPGCGTAPNPTASEGSGKTCSDGIDNDGDGFTDCADPGCAANKNCR